MTARSLPSQSSGPFSRAAPDRRSRNIVSALRASVENGKLLIPLGFLAFLLIGATCPASAGAQSNLPEQPQPQQSGQTGVAGLPNQPTQSAKDAQAAASNPSGLTWDDVKRLFEVHNPTLKADAINVQEMKAEEITAHLRPNPQLTLGADGTQIAPHGGSWTPLRGTAPSPNFSYL